MSIYQIIEDLKNNPGRNDKIGILNEHKDNLTLQRAIQTALDPYKQFYIRKIPSYTPSTQELSIDEFISVLNSTLVTRKVTGHAAINLVAKMLSSLSKDDAEVAKLIIGKDLKCGVADSTVNKVWKGLVPTYPCLLGFAYDAESAKNIRYPTFGQIKADGMRVNIHCDVDGNVTIRGRSGKNINLLGCLEQEFLNLSKMYPTETVFDGELIVLTPSGKVMKRKQGNGILNKAIKNTISIGEASAVRVRLWDAIPYSEFTKNIYKVKYTERLEFLKNAVEKVPNKVYSIIETKILNNLEEVLEYYVYALTLGEEGIMVKNFDHYWEDKRSKDLIKFKAEEECDLVITGWNHGRTGTKWEHHLGSLICESSDGKVSVNVTGLSDELREEVFANINSYLGKIVTIKYNERISSKGKETDSLYLPRIEEFREDKHIADSSEKIK